MNNINLLKLASVTSMAIAGVFGLGVAPAPAQIIIEGCASPTECTLEELLNGGGFLIEDKVFFDWFLNGSTNDIDFSQVIVTPLDDDPLNPGIRFDWGDQLVGGGIEEGTGLGFGYFVDVIDPSFRISGASLELLDFDGTGDGIVRVSGAPINLATGDAFFDPITGEPIVLAVGADAESGEELLTSDVNIPPQDAIAVSNTASGNTFDDGGTFALRSFEQRLNQTPVPEESSPWSLMLGIGVLGAGSVVSKALKSRSNS